MGRETIVKALPGESYWNGSAALTAVPAGVDG